MFQSFTATSRTQIKKYNIDHKRSCYYFVRLVDYITEETLDAKFETGPRKKAGSFPYESKVTLHQAKTRRKRANGFQVRTSYPHYTQNRQDIAGFCLVVDHWQKYLKNVSSFESRHKIFSICNEFI